MLKQAEINIPKPKNKRQREKATLNPKKKKRYNLQTSIYFGKVQKEENKV